jgi:hypothetical protein
MSAFWHDVKLELRFGVPMVFWAVVSLLMIATGPFGTYAALGMTQRALFWLLVVASSALLSLILNLGLRSLVPQLAPRFAPVLAALIATAVLGPLLYLLIAAIVPAEAPLQQSFGDILLLVAALKLGRSALRFAGDAVPVIPTEGATPEDSAPPCRLLQRIDPEARGCLWSISVRDHYVDVTTSAGTTSLLMRLVDAIAETEPVEGARVHRSHWVAWAAVAAVEREGGKVFLRLQNGVRVPVSKNHRDAVDQRGLV